MLGPSSIASLELDSAENASCSAFVDSDSEHFGPRPPTRNVSFATNDGTVSSCNGCLRCQLAIILWFLKDSSDLPASICKTLSSITRGRANLYILAPCARAVKLRAWLVK